MSDRASRLPPAAVTWSRNRLRLTLGGLTAALVLAYLWRSIFVPIGSGEAGVLWSRLGGGTVMGRVYAEGYSAIWPWDRMAIYDTRLQERHDTVGVLTSDGLEVTLGVTARFAPRPETLTTLHRTVGPGYGSTVVWPDVVAAVRHVVRQFRADDLHVIGEADLGAKVDEASRESVERRGVALDRVLITSIKLPDRVEAEIEQRLAEEQKALAGPSLLHQAEVERQRRQIEAESVREFEARAQIPILKWRGLDAMERLAASPNSKVVVMGDGQAQLPLFIDPDRGGATVAARSPAP